MNWRDLPPLASLRAFAAVAEQGGYSQAGRALSVSHAAVAQQVQALERRLGVALVRREGRGIALTPPGADLARVIGSAFAEMAGAVDALTGAEAARPLRISCTHMFAACWLMPRLGDFALRHPEIEIMVNPTPAVVGIEPGGTDIGIRYGAGHWPALEAEALMLTRIAVVAAPNLLGGRRVSDPAQLLDYPWLQEAGTNEVNQWLAAHGVTRSRRVSILHLPGHLALEGARRGDGVSAVARALVEEDIAAGRLAVLFEDGSPEEGYYIVTRPGVARAPLRAFLSWIRRQRADSPPPA